MNESVSNVVQYFYTFRKPDEKYWKMYNKIKVTFNSQMHVHINCSHTKSVKLTEWFDSDLLTCFNDYIKDAQLLIIYDKTIQIANKYPHDVKILFINCTYDGITPEIIRL